MNERTPVAPRELQPNRPKKLVVTVEDTVEDWDLNIVDDTVELCESDTLEETVRVCVDEPDWEIELDAELDMVDVCVEDSD